jgi:hypothetical protein
LHYTCTCKWCERRYKTLPYENIPQKLNWIFMLIIYGWKSGGPGDKSSWQGREPTNNSTHMKYTSRGLNLQPVLLHCLPTNMHFIVKFRNSKISYFINIKQLFLKLLIFTNLNLKPSLYITIESNVQTYVKQWNMKSCLIASHDWSPPKSAINRRWPSGHNY